MDPSYSIKFRNYKIRSDNWANFDRRRRSVTNFMGLKGKYVIKKWQDFVKMRSIFQQVISSQIQQEWFMCSLKSRSLVIILMTSCMFVAIIIASMVQMAQLWLFFRYKQSFFYKWNFYSTRLKAKTVVNLDSCEFFPSHVEF